MPQASQKMKSFTADGSFLRASDPVATSSAVELGS